MVRGEVEHDGAATRHGVLGLRSDVLDEAAGLAGVTPAAAATELDANLAAGAALLAARADALGIAGDDLAAWAPAVALYAGLDGEAAAEYVHNEVYAALRAGAVLETEAGILGVLSPVEVEADFPAPLPPAIATTDFPGAIWRPSPNHNARPAGIGVDMIIIHTCEGNYTGCWSWLANSQAGASAHYVVAPGGEVTQLVRESRRAWHIAAEYSCARNSNVDCAKNGRGSNDFTVGIEHGGFASQASWPTSQIEASARLSCDISRDHAVPRDRFHIVGHGQLQPWNRTDPGKNWPWSHYIDRIKAHCGGGGGSGSTPGAIIVDSNNANNDTKVGYVQVSGNWTPSANVGGYYGTGYYYARTAAVSDAASFWFYLPQAGSRTIDAWWTAASDRSTATPFVVFTGNGTKLGTATRNQQGSGGRWNQLGTYNFPAGWNRVVVSRWTSGSVVVADAIRVR
jgi:hypothetical protein